MVNHIMEAGSRVKLIVSDMDGTLLNSARVITKENRDAVGKAKEQNILFSICTGRIATMVEYFTNTLEIEVPIITANGAVVWDPVHKKPIYDTPLDNDELKGILDWCDYHGMDYCALSLGTSYFSKNSIRLNRFLDYNRIARENDIAEMKYDYFDNNHTCIKGLKIYKVLIYDKEPHRRSLIEEYLNTLMNTAYTSSEPYLLDIAAAGVDKGFGISKLAEYLKLKPEEVCAIGDYENDIPMLDYVGFPIAMGNACEELKKHAILVTKSNDESGLAWAMERYILRK